MGAGEPEKIRAESILEKDGTVKIGDYKPLRGGNSVGGRIPAPFDDMIGVDDVENVETFINFELGCVIHKFPNGDVDELDVDELEGEHGER